MGRAIEVMSPVDAIAADFDIWPGICGKDGQSVPVGSGSPTLRISEDRGGGHRCLTSGSSRRRPVEAAEGGEHVEAFAERSVRRRRWRLTAARWRG